MTTEANDNDPRVSDAYREIAHEKTPAGLDRRILDMAAAEARATHGVPRTWFRPLAWAATIALSFALVLEITQVDEMAQIGEVATPRADADLAERSEESPQPAEAVGKQKDEALVRQQINKRSSDAPAAAKVTISPAQRERAAAAEAASVNTPEPASSPVTADSGRDDMSPLREAEEQDRMLPESARTFAAIAEKKDQDNSCDADARASSETWFECVSALRDAGQTESAEQELEALLAEFPDFREPPGNP